MESIQMNSYVLLISWLSIYIASHVVFAETNLKCLVCQQVVQSISASIEKEDPRKKIQVGSFRIQPDGTQKKSEIKYAGSELHINDVLETVCDSMEDYAQAKNKETGEIALLNLSKDVEKLSTHELVPDPDLNRSLKYYCESFVEDHEDSILDIFKNSSKKPISDKSIELCKITAGYCTQKTDFKDHLEL